MNEDLVAGIFVERSGATLIVAKALPPQIPQPKIEPIVHERVSWGSSDQQDAIERLGVLVEALIELEPNVKHLALACYGPFLSLKPGNANYGTIHGSAHEPFRRTNLLQIVSERLKKVMPGNIVNLSIHTDANACALGELIVQGEPRQTLAFLAVTEGVGLGIVSDGRILRSALHPEIGLIPVRFDQNDPLRPRKPRVRFSKSLGTLANNKSLRDRYEIAYLDQLKGKTISNEMVLNAPDEEFWNLRAYYLAQACLACFSMLAPHKIVIGADLDPENEVAELTRRHFKKFLRERSAELSPMLNFPELGDLNSYIVSSKNPYGDPATDLGYTGSLGLCLAAALGPTRT
jgi:fructokinase